MATAKKAPAKKAAAKPAAPAEDQVDLETVQVCPYVSWDASYDTWRQSVLEVR